jgi:hypothetical protein
LKDHFLAVGHNIPVRYVANPFSLTLPILNHQLDVFTGVGNRHFIEEEI